MLPLNNLRYKATLVSKWKDGRYISSSTMPMYLGHLVSEIHQQDFLAAFEITWLLEDGNDKHNVWQQWKNVRWSKNRTFLIVLHKGMIFSVAGEYEAVTVAASTPFTRTMTRFFIPTDIAETFAAVPSKKCIHRMFQDMYPKCALIASQINEAIRNNHLVSSIENMLNNMKPEDFDRLSSE